MSYNKSSTGELTKGTKDLRLPLLERHDPRLVEPHFKEKATSRGGKEIKSTKEGMEHSLTTTPPISQTGEWKLLVVEVMKSHRG
jgi:hypothetical protein